jgi:hypothetical protein
MIWPYGCHLFFHYLFNLDYLTNLIHNAYNWTYWDDYPFNHSKVNELNDVDVIQNDKLTNDEVHNEASDDQQGSLLPNPKGNDYFFNT